MECSGSEVGGVSGLDRMSSWKDVDRTEDRALTRLKWQRVS